MKKVFLFILVFFSAFNLYAEIEPGMYKVNVSTTLNIRQSPNGPKIGSYNAGDVVQVISSTGDWAKVVGSKKAGWVNANYLTFVGSNLSEQTNSFLSNISFRDLQHYGVFVVLALGIILYFCMPHCGRGTLATLMLLFGASEVFIFAGSRDGAVPWFCEPNDVGWILTIIDFVVASFIVMSQFQIVRAMLSEAGGGFWASVGIGLYLVFGAFILLGGVNGTWYILLGFLLYIPIFLVIFRSGSVYFSLAFMVFSFGLVVSFFGMLGTFIIGFLLFIAVSAFAHSDRYAPRSSGADYRLTDGTELKRDYNGEYYDTRDPNRRFRQSDGDSNTFERIR